MTRKKTSRTTPREPKEAAGHEEPPTRPTLADKLRASGIEVHTLDTLGNLWSEEFDRAGEASDSTGKKKAKPGR
ncbi:MAG: hypothetical protein ABIJ09_17640 [Pseudomonadota bacterium]